MAALADLAQHLEDEGVGTIGSTILVDMMPRNVTEGVVLRQTGGPIDPYLLTMRRTTFQAVIRAASYPSAETKAETVKTTLEGVRQSELGSTFFYGVYPTSEPIPFGREQAGVETFVVNFEAVWRTI